MITSNSISKSFIFIFCIAFLYFVWYFAINLPYQDDCNLIETTMPGMSLKALFINFFNADSDHIQVFPKLTVFLQYKLFGLINFKYLTIFINVLVISTIFCLIKLVKSRISYLYFIPVFVFILQPQLFEISFWVLPGLQHSFAMLFAIMAIYFLKINKKYNIFSLVLAACATYCTGNGFLVFFSIMFILWIYQKPVWYALGSFILCFSLYLFRYKPSDSVKNGLDIGSIFNFQTIFWASPLEIWNRPQYQFGIGLFLIIGLILLFFYHTLSIFITKSSSELNIIKLLSILLFCGATALLISFSREYHVVFSRFKYYTFFGLTSVYLIGIQVFVGNVRKIFGVITGGILIAIGVLSYYVYLINVENTSNRYLADTYNWPNNKTMLIVDQPFLELADHIYSKTSGRTFKIEDDLITKPILDLLVKNAVGKTDISKNPDLKLTVNPYPDKYFKDKHFLLVNNNFSGKKQLSEKWFLVLSDEKRKYIVSCQFSERFKMEFLRTRQYYRNGFYAYIPSFNFAPGTYQIYMLKSQKGKFEMFKTKHIIDMEGSIPILK